MSSISSIGAVNNSLYNNQLSGISGNNQSAEQVQTSKSPSELLKPNNVPLLPAPKETVSDSIELSGTKSEADSSPVSFMFQPRVLCLPGPVAAEAPAAPAASESVSEGEGGISAQEHMPSELSKDSGKKLTPDEAVKKGFKFNSSLKAGLRVYRGARGAKTLAETLESMSGGAEAVGKAAEGAGKVAQALDGAYGVIDNIDHFSDGYSFVSDVVKKAQGKEVSSAKLTKDTLNVLKVGSGHVASAAKQASGAAAAQIAGAAGKAVPIFQAAAGVVTAGIGIGEIRSGVSAKKSAETDEAKHAAKDKIVDGSLDTVSGVATTVAGTATLVAALTGSSVIGAPVAAIALGVAGAASLVKLGHNIFG